MNDPEIRATLNVLTEVVTPALFTDKNLLSLVICRMVNLSLEHGNSDGSCFAYVWLGMILGPHFGDYQAGFRFGRLGYDLVEKRGLHRYQARAYMSFGNLVMPWTRHIQTGRALVRRAFDAANKTGDLTFAAYSCNNLNTNLLATGDPLVEVQREAENGLEFARKARFGLVIDIITAQLGLIRTLRGLTPEFGSFNEERFDESRFEHHLQSDPRLALPECWYWIRKLQARVYANDWASALEAASRAQQLLWTSPSFFEVAEYHFYDALARAAQYDAASTEERPQHLEALVSHHKQFEAWAESCPENFANRAALLAAEIARIEDRALDAMYLYEQAIQSAREHGFVQNEGLAHEVAARFYLARDFETIAHAYLYNARNCYDRWGALGKVKQLDARFPHLHQEEIPTSPAVTIGTPAGQFDVQTVVKSSQALSSEIVLPKLIERLMRIAVEHAGAERGLLILLRGDKPQIEAEATISHGSIDVTVRQTAVTPSDLPQSALHYVIRTQERLVLDDASVRNVYSEDEYVRQKRLRSVLCLPIVKQSKLVGALYLENNLTPCAFTSDRVEVLELLASQAAISLENARLYSDLQRSEDRLRGVIDTIPAHVWSTTPDGSVDFFNQRLMESTGRSIEDLLGWGWGSIVHPDNLERYLKDWRAALMVGEPMESELRIRRADGEYRWFLVRNVPLRDELGNIIKWYGTGIEIEDRKRAEEQLHQARVDLAYVNRVTTMGELTASLAHEVRQPIAAAVTNSNACVRWLMRDHPDLKEAREAATRIVRDATRAAEIISRISLLFNKGSAERESVDVNEVIGEMIVLLGSEAVRYNIAVRTELATDLPQVMGDRVQLQQVLMNLMINGIDAMNDVDGVRELAIKSQPAEDEQLLVSVSDTGVGLPPQADQIFNAFFTTKPHGTGMGLRISRSIVESHGGRLWAADNFPRGASFYLTLPIKTEAHE
ncbi:MAG TPA: ATP-binding protein [Edaphobacter sp.]|nr:ATP-binding protein [Edaphobacter sp.]